MNLPTLTEAERLLREGEAKNPGGWADHSRYVALAARSIAENCSSLDAETAYILGLLHDIGRQKGVTKMRHGLDGYRFLSSLGYADAARVCLTHSFPIKDMALHEGKWDCSEDDTAFVANFIQTTDFNDYDKLLQLCDALAVASGICLMEQRLIDASLRNGVNRLTVAKWKALFELQRNFERAIGCSIYSVMPGVIENTFGLTPSGHQNAF